MPRPQCRVELINIAGFHVAITPTNHSLRGHDYTVGELTCTVETPRGTSSLLSTHQRNKLQRRKTTDEEGGMEMRGETGACPPTPIKEERVKKKKNTH